MFHHLSESGSERKRSVITPPFCHSRAHEVWVGVVVGIGEVVKEAFAGFPIFWRYFCKPDDGFCSFNLTEKGPHVVEAVMAPMLKQAGGLGCDLPGVWVLQTSPLIYIMAEFINNRRGIVLLLLR